MSERPTVKLAALALAGYLLASLVYTYPLVTAPAHANRLDSPDALLNTWIVSWVLYQLPRAPGRLYDANIFFPDSGSLAYSENLLTGALLAAPVKLVSDDPVLMMNVALLAAFALTGLAGFLLALDVTGDRLASGLSGLVFAFAPFRFAHLPHLQLQLAFGLPLGLLFVRRICRGPNRAMSALGFAVTAFLTFGSSVYYTVYLASAAPVVALFELTRLEPRERRSAAGGLVAGAIGAIAMTLPLAVPYMDKLSAGTVRSLAAAAEFSAGVTEYLSSFSHVHGFLPSAEEPLFPGFVALALAVWALVRKPSRDAASFFAVGALGAFVSFGPALGLFTLLYHALAPYRALRVPSRAGVLVLLAVAVLAAIGLARVRHKLVRAGLVVLAAAECLAAPLPLRFERPDLPPIYAAVSALEEPGAMVELPLPPPERFQDNALYVYRSIFHRRTLVNGYSGFAPESYRRAYRRLMRRNLARGLEASYREGVRFVLAHEGRLGPRIRRQIDEALEEGLLELLAESPPDRLYAIRSSSGTTAP